VANIEKDGPQGRGYINSGSKSVTVQFDFFGECFLYEFAVAGR
jgi:hypothetical protein